MATRTVTMTEAQSRLRDDNSPLELRVFPEHNHVIPETGSEPPMAAADATSGQLDSSTLLKLICAGFSFFVAGVNDGSIGALIPHVIRYYGITTAIVTGLYGASFFGWFFAAVTNTHLSQRLGLGAMLAIGAFLQLAAQALRAWPVPPFGLYVFTFWLTCLGQAYQDAHANTFVASRQGSTAVHRWLGFIHAMYMAGCLAGPFAASSIASSGTGSNWWLFYTVPLALGVVNLGLVVAAFRDSITVLKPDTGAQQAEAGMSASALVNATLKEKSVWLLSLFFFFYLGVVVTASGWVVEYLVSVRNGNLTQMGYIPAGFSGGALLGRILLPEPTHSWGERRMVFLYCIFCLVFQLVFWLVPSIIAASVAISFLGFFSGPFFATAISVGTKLFPPEINSTAISFVFVFAQIGGSLFPTVTGVLGARIGLSVVQPMLIGLICAMGISWLLVPQPQIKGE